MRGHTRDWIPACAGMTGIGFVVIDSLALDPRLRGDDRSASRARVTPRGSEHPGSDSYVGLFSPTPALSR
ncbi:MAG: hypothetical protein M0Z94_09015, partial [Dehalococcoidales bacterium]|nr:hypothetical protein [Dehalococcoidales bacterium]